MGEKNKMVRIMRANRYKTFEAIKTLTSGSENKKKKPKSITPIIVEYKTKGVHKKRCKKNISHKVYECSFGLSFPPILIYFIHLISNSTRQTSRLTSKPKY